MNSFSRPSQRVYASGAAIRSGSPAALMRSAISPDVCSSSRGSMIRAPPRISAGWKSSARHAAIITTAGSSRSASTAAGHAAMPGRPRLSAATTTGDGPEDLATSANGKYLYDEVGAAGAVDEFRINSDGSLTPIGSVPGLGAGIEGIAVG